MHIVIPCLAPARSFRDARTGSHRIHQPTPGCTHMSTDPFSPSVIPFEVPEQVRAFAEKGVSQARDNYARFKEAAETQNNTIEAVFSVFSNGAKEYSAKVMEMTKQAASANLDF